MTPQATIVAPTAFAIALLLASPVTPAWAQTSGGPPLGAQPPLRSTFATAQGGREATAPT